MCNGFLRFTSSVSSSDLSASSMTAEHFLIRILADHVSTSICVGSNPWPNEHAVAKYSQHSAILARLVHTSFTFRILMHNTVYCRILLVIDVTMLLLWFDFRRYYNSHTVFFSRDKKKEERFLFYQAQNMTEYLASVQKSICNQYRGIHLEACNG